jgi:hypothetical protein
MNQTPKNPRIRELAREAAGKIKSLTVAHQTQIEAIYQEFREQAAIIQESNAEELHSPSATRNQPTAASDQQERENFRLNDLLEALAQYSERRSDWSRVTEHLVAASGAVVDARKQLTGE